MKCDGKIAIMMQSGKLIFNVYEIEKKKKIFNGC